MGTTYQLMTYTATTASLKHSTPHLSSHFPSSSSLLAASQNNKTKASEHLPSLTNNHRNYAIPHFHPSNSRKDQHGPPLVPSHPDTVLLRSRTIFNNGSFGWQDLCGSLWEEATTTQSVPRQYLSPIRPELVHLPPYHPPICI